MPRAEWCIDDSRALYRVAGWGRPYFDINSAGHVDVCPCPTRPARIDLCALVQSLQERGLQLPLLLRFPHILQDRIRVLNESFAAAIKSCGYQGQYRGVYPVKVNQQRHLVDEVVAFGAPWGFGLEVGSKPELLIALSAMSGPGGLIVCNGYKDSHYMETALLAQKLGHTVIIVLERFEELELVLQASALLALRPVLGVRAKLSSRGVGRWADSAGERAKFGLTTAEVVAVVDRLTAEQMCDCLQLLHFHIGSQVASIGPVKHAMREAANVYVELVRMGCAMGYLDVGGGLAVDYDGSQSEGEASRNYELREYACDVVAAVQSACERAQVPEPTLVSESGRAVAAYQSVLVFEVVGVDGRHADIVTGRVPDGPDADVVPPGAHRVLHAIGETLAEIAGHNLQESWHDAQQWKEEAQSLFKLGYLSLRELALAERLFLRCCRRIQALAGVRRDVPQELQQIERILSSIYYCNFSIFQSAPDIWAIAQRFPIMPIHRLDEKPTVHASLADLTCDSDGVIKAFIGDDAGRSSLALHSFVPGERYCLAMFLGGAYQEILGDLHNLFGDTNAVHVRLLDESEVAGGAPYEVAEVIKGDAIEEVLRYVQYEPGDMVERVRRQAERALGRGEMNIAQMRLLVRHYEESLRSYTYLTGDESRAVAEHRLTPMPPRVVSGPPWGHR
ncbi:MAG: biosynthetic arginine decarboxylase [Polyangiales bacterium]